MTYQKSFSVVKNVLLAFVAVCFLVSCQDDEIVNVSGNPASTDVNVGESNVASMTIIGENTEISETVDCSSCTYVVDVKSEIIDGQDLGLKPGSIICLNSALKYGNLSFVNLRGTEEHPIIIANSKIIKN